MTDQRVPAQFRDTRDYRTDAIAVEAGHDTANEQALYEAIAASAVDHSRQLGRPIDVADLCCASGGCAEQVQKHVRIGHLYLVDNEPSMIEAAKVKHWLAESTSVELADAVTWTPPNAVDVVLMNSAYHHIEDARKVDYLRNAGRMLRPNGKILVGEHFLPEYDPASRQSYETAVLHFYGERLGYLERIGTAKDNLAVIRQTARYVWLREYEYQVSYRTFEKHVAAAQLVEVDAKRLWPPTGDLVLPIDSGTFACQLQHSGKDELGK